MDNDVRDGLAFEPVVDNPDKGTHEEPITQNTQPDQTPDEPAFDPRTAYKGLEEQLKNFQRELGQSRTMQSKLDKLLAMQERGSQTQKPTSQDDVFKKYSPEVLSESEALITALWEKKYGDQWRQQNEFRTEAQTERVINTHDSSARAYAGKDYENLRPVMESIVASARQAAQQGDEEAREFLNMQTGTPKAGARLLVALARESYSGQAGAQSAQASQQLQAKGAKIAGSTPGGSTKSQGKKDPNSMTLAELRAAAEAEALAG